jgi:hypothetical protein
VTFSDVCTLLATDQGVWVSSCRGGLGGSPQDVLERIDPRNGDVSYKVAIDRWGNLALAQGRLWLTAWVGDRVQIEARDPRTGKPTGTVLTVKPGPHQWDEYETFGPPGVFVAVGASSFWLTHVDRDDVVRLGFSRGRRESIHGR